MDYVAIPLYARDGSVAAHTLVDAADADALSQWRWYIQRGQSGKRYAIRATKANGHRQVHSIHRLLMGLPPARNGLEVDHINGDSLDNRRENLRVVTHAQNQQNKRASRGSTSRHRGVHWENAPGAWVAEVRVAGRRYRRGYFRDELDAAKAASRWRSEAMTHSVEPAGLASS